MYKSSPYLLQNPHNPMDWKPWIPVVAVAEALPIL
ncbi:DUF255 domain-containing protein [Maribacter aurantiacus]|uniref:DUF255 domain-containing protein n=1 Tax=Maribacter aurantiacus TaxID=1882343 RepID=A0A5R8M4N2_9FLAO|nr:DUF255 domain-containing protein [Maribacter aurantiacus]